MSPSSKRASQSANISWSIFFICVAHFSVWSLGVTEVESRDFFAKQNASLHNGGTLSSPTEQQEAIEKQYQLEWKEQQFFQRIVQAKQAYQASTDQQGVLQAATSSLGRQLKQLLIGLVPQTLVRAGEGNQSEGAEAGAGAAQGFRVKPIVISV